MSDPKQTPQQLRDLVTRACDFQGKELARLQAIDPLTPVVAVYITRAKAKRDAYENMLSAMTSTPDLVPIKQDGGYYE
jgi:hypothetical protein